jgi:hypothetical protein
MTSKNKIYLHNLMLPLLYNKTKSRCEDICVLNNTAWTNILHLFFSIITSSYSFLILFPFKFLIGQRGAGFSLHYIALSPNYIKQT